MSSHPQVTTSTRRPHGGVLARFRTQRLAMGSLIFLALVTFIAFLGPQLFSLDFRDISATPLQAPSADHLFGTDALGHDVLSQVLRGLQRSLVISAIVAVISTLLGLIIGTVAGYFGGMVDSLAMRLVDLTLMVPLVAVVGLLALRTGGSSSAVLIMGVAVAAFFWAPNARVIRAEVRRLRRSEFVVGATIAGASHARIMARHILPHLLGPTAVIATAYVAGAIGVEATLSFLGIGLQPPDVSLGLLIKTGISFSSTAWWMFYFPSFVVLIIVLPVQFVGDGIQAASGTGAVRS